MIKKIGATLLLISNASFASTASLNGLSFDLNQHEADKFSNLSGDFGFQASDLVDDVGEVAGNKHFGFMNVKYQSYNSANYYKGLSISSQINNEEVMQYSIKEALIEHRGVNSRLAIGRTNLDWSHADEIWGLGKVNNRINFDYFEPGQEGLVGIFYDIKSASGFELGVFGSFLYIPELNQGLIVDKKNRSVACKTMWCDAPLSSAEIEGKNVPIHYDVNYPDTSKVVNRVSAGLKLGFEYKSFYINSFYMRKPENTMSIIAEVSVESDLSEVTAEVTPQFYNHDVRGGNIELKLSERFKLYGSYISV
ncbi:MAG: hypothetical protein HON90_01195, partial [Halobacteriovoraceae bacterium]|nr:hypothetical protein [Halobacteriovoraceae bacterium]